MKLYRTKEGKEGLGISDTVEIFEPRVQSNLSWCLLKQTKTVRDSACYMWLIILDINSNLALISQVINIANLKYFEAGKIALELGNMTTAKNVDKSEASKIFHDWMIKLHQGQVSRLRPDVFHFNCHMFS